MMSAKQRFSSNISRTFAILILVLAPIGCGEKPLPEIPAFEELGFENALDAVRQQMLKNYERCQEDPKSGSRHGYFGMLLSAYDKHAAASLFFERARIFEPAEFRWAYYLANSAKHLGEYEKAADVFRQALIIEPDNVEARMQLAGVLLETNEIDESIALYRLTTQELPERIDAWLGLGKALDRSGDFQSAITALKRAKNLGVQYGDVRYALAGALSANGEKEAAAREFAAYESRSRNKSTLTDRYVRAVIRLNASDGPFLAKADYQIARGQFKEAVRFFRSALEINPHNQDAWGGLVYALGRLGDMNDTKKSYEDALAEGIQYKRLHFTYAEALRKLDRFKEAREIMRKAIELDPKYTEALLAMGELELKLNAPAEAVEQFKTATTVVPNDRTVQLRLAKARNAAGLFDQAASQLEELSNDPAADKAQTLLTLALAYRGLKRSDQAMETLLQAREAALNTYDSKTEKTIDDLLEDW
ncbi:MAG: tetratricopeptide repeat protein [Gammaproteobacteria bacterium]